MDGGRHLESCGLRWCSTPSAIGTSSQKKKSKIRVRVIVSFTELLRRAGHGVLRARSSGGVIRFGEGSPKEGDRIIEWYKLEGGARKRLSTFFTRPDLAGGSTRNRKRPLFTAGISVNQTTPKITPPDLRERVCLCNVLLYLLVLSCTRMPLLISDIPFKLIRLFYHHCY